METAPAIDGAALRAARERAGVSQNDLARILGLPGGGQRVSRWERAEARPRTPAMLHALARALGVEASGLLVPQEEPTLRWLRFAAGLSVDELAAQVGVSASTVKRWEAGGLVHPSEAMIASLGKALHTSRSVMKQALYPQRAQPGL